MKIRHAILSIFRKKVFSLILIIQVILGLYAFYNVLEVKNIVESEKTKICSYFNNKRVYQLIYAQSIGGKYLSSIDESAVERIFYKINNKYDNIIMGDYTFGVGVKIFDGFEKFNKYPGVKMDSNGIPFFNAKNILINKRYIHQFDIKLQCGRFFNNNEWDIQKKITRVPIIVGSNYSEYFKIGDTLKVHKNNDFVECEIIGIAEKGQIVPGDFLNGSELKYVNIDNYIISTFSQFDSYKLILSAFNSYNYVLFDENISDLEIGEKLNEVKELFQEELNLNVKISDVNKCIRAELDTYVFQEKIFLLTASIIWICIIVTIILNILNSIKNRKKEFAIHIFIGATLKDIAITLYLEILIVLIFAYGIILSFITIKYSYISLKNSVYLFLVTILISVVATIIPITKLINLKINEIIKGDE